MDTSEILYWRLSDQANLVAMQANDSRATIESNQVKNGEQLISVHNEALLDYPEMERLIFGGIKFLDQLGIDYSGIAADLGSGVGTGATIISKIDEISKIYAVEYAEQFVTKIMPKVFYEFSAYAEKIIRTIGDFNNIQLDDNSLSLIVEIDSFHHSEDLNKTLRECYRVLKPGGAIVSIDRAWPDNYSRDELEKKLDIEYSESRKALYGISLTEVYRRRDNGEHEYTIKDWLSFFGQNKFDAHVFSQVHPRVLNRLLLSKIPTFEFTIFLSGILSRMGLKRHIVYGLNPTRKLFVCIKK